MDPQCSSEEDGKDYFFITPEAFEAKVQLHEFLEHAEVFGCHRYGTLKDPVTTVLSSGNIILLDIDVQGGMQVRDNMPESVRIFILPPSEEELIRRLESRGREDEDSIQRRFREAKSEIKLAQESGAYEYFITNDNLELAIAETEAIIQNARSNTTSAS